MKFLLLSDTHYGYGKRTHNIHMKLWKKVRAAVEKGNISALLWGGDLAASKQRHLKRSLEMARAVLPELPIALVRGNHDWWDEKDEKANLPSKRSFHELDSLHQKWFLEHNIHHLESSPLILSDVAIIGWDGWYRAAPTDTKDDRFMFLDVGGKLMHEFMAERAWKQFEKVLDFDTSMYRKVIALTHFNVYANERHGLSAHPRFLEWITPKVDVLCCGHTHEFKDEVHNGCRILNCGSHYDAPKFLVFEV